MAEAIDRIHEYAFRENRDGDDDILESGLALAQAYYERLGASRAASCGPHPRGPQAQRSNQIGSRAFSSRGARTGEALAPARGGGPEPARRLADSGDATGRFGADGVPYAETANARRSLDRGF